MTPGVNLASRGKSSEGWEAVRGNGKGKEPIDGKICK